MYTFCISKYVSIAHNLRDTFRYIYFESCSTLNIPLTIYKDLGLKLYACSDMYVISEFMYGDIIINFKIH